MKNILFLLLSIFIYSCGGKSVEWSKARQNEFVKSCMSNSRQLGSNSKPYCECMAGKVKTKYKTVSAVENIKLKEMSELASSCMQDIGGLPKKGSKWSKEEKEFFVANCMVNNELPTEALALEYCNCILNTLENQFPNPEYIQSLTMQEMEELGMGCVSKDMIEQQTESFGNTPEAFAEQILQVVKTNNFRAMHSFFPTVNAWQQAIQRYPSIGKSYEKVAEDSLRAKVRKDLEQFEERQGKRFERIMEDVNPRNISMKVTPNEHDGVPYYKIHFKLEDNQFFYAEILSIDNQFYFIGFYK